MDAGLPIEQELRRLAEPLLAEEGLELVELSLRGSGGRRVLRVDIDRPGARSVDLTDCQRLSRALEARLDEADLIPGAYVLEVSSPGVDRPLRSAADFRRNRGRRIRVRTAEAEGGSRQLRGVLLGVEEGELTLDAGGGEPIRIPLDRIVHARQDVEL